jgi:hypothetical protein
MKTLSSFVAALLLATALPVVGHSAATPGSPNNNQVAANVVALSTLPSTSGSGGPRATTGTPAGAGKVEVLCLAASASVTQPFFTGTDLSCAP